MNHHKSQPVLRGGAPYTGNQQYRGNHGKRSCGRCARFELQLPGRGSHSPRWGFICSTCTTELAARTAARQQRQAQGGATHTVNIVSLETVRDAIERALSLDPTRDIDAACQAAAQALCQPLEAVRETAQQAGLLAAEVVA